MGVSIYYTARRETPIDPGEQAAVAAIESRYPVEKLMESVGATELNFDGEGFDVYPTDEHTEPGVIFEGSTKLPLYSEEAFCSAAQYWCSLLSEVRRVLHDADWEVHVDDLPISWDPVGQAFDSGRFGD